MRIFVSTTIAVAAFLVSASGTPGMAQQSGPENPAGASHATLQVAIPVIVRDKRGAPVTGLAAADLRLSDNGHAQVIRNLTAGPGVPLQTGLLVDTSRGMLRALDSERKAAENFLDLMPQSSSSGSASAFQAFIIHFDREVELVEDLTASKTKLHSDLEQLGPTQRATDTEGPETTDGGSPRRNFRAGSPQLYDAIFLAASDVLKSKDGRKALIVFSNGVDGGSRESLNEAIEAAERASIPVYTIYFRGDEQRTEEAIPGGRRRGGMGGGWPGSGGGWPGGHTGNGRGSRSAQVDGKKILQQISSRTGGLYFEARKTAELSDIYSHIATDLNGQYLLSYTPDKVTGDAEFHKLELKAVQPDVSVTAPEGYFSSQDNTR
jgi:VWFA-related protein